MRLEITPTEEVLLEGLTKASTEYMRTSFRLKNHTIATSNELFDKWEEYFSRNNESVRFNDWFATIISNMEQFKKVQIGSIDDIKGVDTDKEKITIATAKSSKDKIVIGIEKPNARIKNREVKFIKKDDFNKEKQQTINSAEISDVLEQRKVDRIFDIYETPITLKITEGSDANTLRDYLSKFVNGTKNLYVKDAYLYDSVNQNNFREYILPLVDKESCQITLETTWGDEGKGTMEQRLHNYDGYNITLKPCRRDDKHSSFIRTDKFEIILGYRLKIFGSNGKTKAENITINRL